MLTTFLCPTASLLIAGPTGHPRKDYKLIMRLPYPPVASARVSLRPTPHYEPPGELAVTVIHTWKHNAWKEIPGVVNTPLPLIPVNVHRVGRPFA